MNVKHCEEVLQRRLEHLEGLLNATGRTDLDFIKAEATALRTALRCVSFTRSCYVDAMTLFKGQAQMTKNHMYRKTMKQWVDEMLALPIAGKISGEDDEHPQGSPEWKIGGLPHRCGCDRCKIIRIKRHKAFRFSRSKCSGCGELFVSIYKVCDKCRKEAMP